MKIAITLLISIVLSGCSSIMQRVPSFWDANQSQRIVDIAVAADSIDCEQPQWPQAQGLDRDLTWFRKYSETKGPRQTDVLRLVEPLEETVGDWLARSQRSEPSTAYCEIKKSVLIEQSTRAAQAVQARF